MSNESLVYASDSIDFILDENINTKLTSNNDITISKFDISDDSNISQISFDVWPDLNYGKYCIKETKEGFNITKRSHIIANNKKAQSQVNVNVNKKLEIIDAKIECKNIKIPSIFEITYKFIFPIEQQKTIIGKIIGSGNSKSNTKIITSITNTQNKKEKLVTQDQNGIYNFDLLSNHTGNIYIIQGENINTVKIDGPNTFSVLIEESNIKLRIQEIKNNKYHFDSKSKKEYLDHSEFLSKELIGNTINIVHKIIQQINKITKNDSLSLVILSIIMVSLILELVTGIIYLYTRRQLINQNTKQNIFNELIDNKTKRIISIMYNVSYISAIIIVAYIIDGYTNTYHMKNKLPFIGFVDKPDQTNILPTKISRYIKIPITQLIVITILCIGKPIKTLMSNEENKYNKSIKQLGSSFLITLLFQKILFSENMPAIKSIIFSISLIGRVAMKGFLNKIGIQIG